MFLYIRAYIYHNIVSYTRIFSIYYTNDYNLSYWVIHPGKRDDEKRHFAQLQTFLLVIIH